MTNKHKQFSKLTIGLAAGLVFTAAGVVGAFILNSNSKAFAEPTAVTKAFAFDGVEGWTQGATDEKSMLLFNAKGSNSCFVSVELKSGTADVAAELKVVNDQVTGRGFSIDAVATRSTHLKTSSGAKQYDLHQSEVQGSTADDNIQTGQEFGFVQLEEDFVKIAGNCNTAEQLEDTIPAIEAIRLN